MSTSALPLRQEPGQPHGVTEILERARSSWLKNTEVTDLLVNHRQYGLHVSLEPPVRPPGGCLYLFDRRAVRFFRKDGHNWRKKADGKTVRETHEKLKVGNVDMLNCYYAHGDEKGDSRLQRRCYWLLEADEDIVLVHYLNTAMGGPGSRSRGMSAGYHTRAAAAAPALLRAAAAAPVDSDDEDYSPAASSDEGLGQRQYSGSAAASSQLESPFLTKQRELHAHAHARRTHPHLLAMQSQFSNPAAPDVYARAADALTNRAAGGGGDRRSPAAVAAAAASAHPAVLAQLQARQARQDAASQMGPPPPALTLGPRPMALASAAGAAADGWTVGNRRAQVSGVMEHHPLLPSMSLDSFLNFVEDPAGTHGEAPAKAAMLRQGSDPLRLDSLANTWDEEGGIMLNGNLPSLNMGMSLGQQLGSRSTAILGDDELTEQVAPLPAHLLHNATRSESGHEFLGALNRSGGGAGPAAGPDFMAALMGAGLRSRSWQANAARMQLAQNTERDGIDFERNRRFTLRAHPEGSAGLPTDAQPPNAGSRPMTMIPAEPYADSWENVRDRAPHGAVAQPRTPATPAQPRSCGNSPLLWMQAPGSGERQQSLQLQQQQHSAASTPFQAMQAMQLEAGMVAQQRAMIRQQLQAQQESRLEAFAKQEDGDGSPAVLARPSQEHLDAAAKFQLALQRQRSGQLPATSAPAPAAAASSRHPFLGRQSPTVKAEAAPNQHASDTSTATAMQRSLNQLSADASVSGGTEPHVWGGGDAAALQDTGDAGAALAARALELEAELAALDRSMMQGMLMASSQPATAAALEEQLRGWEADVARLEGAAQQVAVASGARAELLGQLGGAGRPVPTVPESEQPDPSLVVFEVLDFTPEWDCTAGGSKLLLTGSVLPGARTEAHTRPLFIKFDQTEVPALVLQSGVLRCRVPPHPAGVVRICLTNGDGRPRSRLHPFEYRDAPESDASVPTRPELLLSDRHLQVYLIKQLMDGRSGGGQQQSGEGGAAASSPSTGESPHGGGDGSGRESRQQRLLLGVEARGGGVDVKALLAIDERQRVRLLSLLVQLETQTLALQANRERQRADAIRGSPLGSPSAAAPVQAALNRLSPCGLALLHLNAALGYEWGVRAALLAGTDVHLRDAWGHTALHWAASRGHEAVTALLLSKKANAALLSTDSPGHPPVTAADLAAANGHSGLAAFLGESLLNELLANLKIENRRLDAVMVAAAGSGPEQSPSHRKRTRAQRSFTADDAQACALGSAGRHGGGEGALEPLDAGVKLEAAKEAATAIEDAYARYRQRQTARDWRRTQLNSAQLASLTRMEQSSTAWRLMLERAKLPEYARSSSAYIHGFLSLGERVIRLYAALKRLVACEEDDGASADGAPYQRSVASAVAHVQTLGGSEAARLQYERIQAAHVAATSQHVLPATKLPRQAEEPQSPLLILGHSPGDHQFSIAF